MATIITGAQGSLGYWQAAPKGPALRAFSTDGTFTKPIERSFARLSAFAANGNHAPTDFDGAICWDEGMDLLFRIAGVT